MASIKLAGDTSGEVTISAPAVAGTTTLELPATSSTLATQNALGVRNLIINGDMRIDQRNAGASITPTSSTYTLDRWQAAINVASKFSVQQVTDSPVGATHSVKATSLSAYSIGASEICTIRQHIEGYNTAHLDWGTANAKTVTLSFWVKSSLTGTFGGSIMEGAAASRSYPFTYTISSANTWEQKTVTIAGDTSGTWSTTNTSSIDVLFSLGSGSSMIGTASIWAGTGYYGATGQTNLVATNGATLQLSLVQLEVGDTATPFEHRPYDMELARCLRYFERFDGISVPSQTISAVDVPNRPETYINYYRKRTSPVITGSSGVLIGTMANSFPPATAGPFTYVGTYPSSALLFYSVSSGVSVNSLSGINFVYLPSGQYINIDAEL